MEKHYQRPPPSIISKSQQLEIKQDYHDYSKEPNYQRSKRSDFPSNYRGNKGFAKTSKVCSNKGFHTNVEHDKNYNNGKWMKERKQEDHQNYKKKSLNHLLNFQLVNKSNDNPGSGPISPQYTHGRYPRKKFSKETFLQANCRIVVRDTKDHSAFASDPDKFVDWEDIEQVIIQMTECVSCPICLSKPTAAKITKCGHVYCWACILHYFSIDQGDSSKCPICFEVIESNEMRSVLIQPSKSYNIGCEISMRLMVKEKDSMIIRQVNHQQNDENNNKFSKIMFASANYIAKIIEQEFLELNAALEMESDVFERSFFVSALDCLKEKEDLNNMLIKTLKPSYKEKNQETFIPIKSYKSNVQYLDAFSESVSSVEPDNCQLEETEDAASPKPLKSEEAPPSFEFSQLHLDAQQNSDLIYFYQAEDGQRIFINDLNYKILIRQYGKLSNCPFELKAKIVFHEDMVMDKVLRKRYKFLNHLPLNCEFKLVELSLTPPLISEEVYLEFKAEVKMRERARLRKQKIEQRRSNIIETANNKKLGLDNDVTILRSVMYNDKIETETNIISDEPSTPLIDADPNDDCSMAEDSPMSFAQMLKNGKQQVKGNVGNDSSSKLVTRSSESDDEDVSPTHQSYQISFCDAIDQALKNLTIDKNDKGEKPSKYGTKKKKQKILFSTMANH